MAKIRFYGLCPAHSLKYGLKHKNIAKKLYKNNWERKAIVRNGKYLYIQKGTEYIKKNNNKIIFTVFVNEYEKQFSFDTLDDCLYFANTYDDCEGKYPREFSSRWHIGPVMKFPKKLL